MPGDVLDRILRPLRRRVATSRYPDAPPDLPATARGLPELDTTRCDRSGACVDACPTRAITLTASAWLLDAGRCILCDACSRACPRDAIKLGQRIELAVFNRADLTTRRSLEGRR